jgi:hypothetical protein
MEIKNKLNKIGNSVFSKSLILAFLVVILFAVGLYSVIRIKPPAPQDSQILAQLKTIILLPDDVTPTMALVTNADVLKKQQPVFFANVKNGDRLVIYPDIAIIYDYQANKIIKVGPVQTAAPAQAQNAPAQQNN